MDARLHDFLSAGTLLPLPLPLPRARQTEGYGVGRGSGTSRSLTEGAGGRLPGSALRGPLVLFFRQRTPRQNHLLSLVVAEGLHC